MLQISLNFIEFGIVNNKLENQRICASDIMRNMNYVLRKSVFKCVQLDLIAERTVRSRYAHIPAPEHNDGPMNTGSRNLTI